MSEVSTVKPPRARSTPASTGPGWAGSLADAALIATLLALTFLLGVFPLKDTDFWWHLRTGDWIRANGRVPTHDLYTFTVPDHPWIDLHWGFEVALSWGFANLGGIVGLNLAKCAITCAGMLLLITARRRGWPIWVMVLAWLPALFVLGGRMYIRPETITFLYLSAFLAILFRWKERPKLAFLLPVVQLLWVNTQGLFVLGPIILCFALLDAALMPGAFSAARQTWWKTVGIAVVLTGLACLFNPYGLHGAIFPLELARTMGNPIFSERIAELRPIPAFIEETGLGNVPLRIHLGTMLLGALSFLVPLIWKGLTRVHRPGPIEEPTVPARKTKPGRPTKAKADKPRKKKTKVPAKPIREEIWRLSPFRFLLFAAFSLLSLQATRNSHQFAAVVGTVTAWNLGEWAAAIQRRRAETLKDEASRLDRWPVPLARTLTFTVMIAALVGVASGGFYTLTGEGRTVGLGEEPLWFPHDAVGFAGRAGMPERFLGFHNGHPALYEYRFGPDRKTYADARLEVIGPELFGRYIDLQQQIGQNAAGWDRALDDLGRPVVLTDNVEATQEAATLLASARWICAYFDPIAAVFLHEDDARGLGIEPVDFDARHFRPDPDHDPKGVAALEAASKALLKFAANLMKKGREAPTRPLITLGMDYARRVTRTTPNDPDGWKLLGQFEAVRDPWTISARSPRFRMEFDPVLDLAAVRSTFAFREALRHNPDDFLGLLALSMAYGARQMSEAMIPPLGRLVQLAPINREQIRSQLEAEEMLPRLRAEVEGGASSGAAPNRGEHERLVNADLTAGRAGAAADRIEHDFPAGARSWDLADRLATLRLHLGEPDRARLAWQEVTSPPRPALRSARLAVTFLVEGEFETARRLYREALAVEPDLFEARYGLAVLEFDLGRAAEALDAARKAVAQAPNDLARRAAEAIAHRVEPFTTGPQGIPAPRSN